MEITELFSPWLGGVMIKLSLPKNVFWTAQGQDENISHHRNNCSDAEHLVSRDLNTGLFKGPLYYLKDCKCCITICIVKEVVKAILF